MGTAIATKIVNCSGAEAYENSAREAAAALRGGALVVFPTETVYGVAAGVTTRKGIERLRSVKQRAGDKAFTVHIGRRSDVSRYVSAPSPLLRRLVRKGWPGPLTILCHEPKPAETEIGRSCTPEQLREIYHEGVVGLRYPDHPVAQVLLAAAEIPVVASSANVAGHAPPLDAEAALRELEGQVELVLDAGRTRHSAASTIVEVRGRDWRIVREGALPERMLRRLVESSVLFVCTGNTCRSPMAEALFRQKLAARLDLKPDELEKEGYVIGSAGTFAGSGAPASAGTLNELRRRGLDAAAHCSRPLTVELIAAAERIFVMSPEHRDELLYLAPGAAGKVRLLDARPISDPAGGTPEDYAACAAQIEGAVDAVLKEFVDEDLHW